MSGTQSAIVPTRGTKKWFDHLRRVTRRPTTKLWSSWFYKSVNAGEVESFPGITLVTMRAAGYFAFEDQPEMTEHLFEKFIKGETLH